MSSSSEADLLERLRALPAAGPLLPRLPAEPPVYLVGGAVRDLLLGGEPVDLDLVVEGDADALAGRLGGAAVLHGRFGTAVVRLDGHSYDIATARRERYPQPGALPEVEPAPLHEDLRRRDFTVNALALALSGDRVGELIALPGAEDDLGRRVLRVLHDESFGDDPTRLLRLVRYAARLAPAGFAIEPHTLTLAQSALGGGALETVSGDRIGAELRLLARERDPVAAIDGMNAHGLGLDEALAPGFGLRAPELARSALALLPSDGRADVLVLAAAGLQLPADRLRELLERHAFEAGERDAIVAAAAGARPAAARLTTAESPSQIDEALHGAGPEGAALAGALGPAQAARRWLSELRHVRLEIDGRDLLLAGIPEGPAIGRGLRAALADKLDGLVGGREQELARAVGAAR
jgi:tRNA nucleotidyltransferase (CCA-adding enzyme)